MLVTDALALSLLVGLSYSLRLSEFFPYIHDKWLFVAAPVTLLTALYISGFYKAIIRYLGAEVAWSIILAVVASSVILAASSYMVSGAQIPRSVFFIWGALALLYLGGSRFLVRRTLYNVLGKAFNSKPVAVFGAGYAGAELISGLLTGAEYKPVLVVDDDTSKQGTLIAGIPVVGRERLVRAVSRQEVDTVLLAMPSMKRAVRMEVVNWLESLQVHVQTVPGLADIASGKARLEQVKNVAIEDLLGRDSVSPRTDLLGRCITGKGVLVTGAGGSIGSELCRQILSLKPRTLVLLEQNEFGLYCIEGELRKTLAAMEDGGTVELHASLGSVVDEGGVERVCRRHKIDTVYHAAAYKHVPMVEECPEAGVKNNILGTLSAALGAEAAGVNHFILVSTDKAVRPTNVMGATKRFAELILQAMSNRGSATTFSMVRFGNVLGSSGSVVPLFREQIEGGGPVTVTHPDVIRYFMTIPEASQLVIQAGGMARGGEVFVLDMGEPVRIVDLATTMIHLMGLTVRDEKNPAGDIGIVFSGLRPGEKLYEELLVGECSVGTEHPMIMQANEERLEWEELVFALEGFRTALKRADREALRDLLKRYVGGYQPGSSGNVNRVAQSTRSLVSK
ncbi:MAG: polysaccharide biosynthesis protein [Alcanivoracaceae bacterium]|nr:polysaccharide biosynthesis protein [Alcanivoracaceae bacterium]